MLAAAGPLALVAAAVSVLLQGFRYAVSNNEFHIPIALRYQDLPQFAGDAFTQTLSRYTSPVFPALSLVATEASLPWLFLALHVLGRWLMFYAVVRMLRHWGLTPLRRAAALSVLVLSSGLYYVTGVGRQDLMPDYFTHSAIAQGLGLLAIASMLERRWVAACVLAAVTFDVNAFLGVWLALPLLLTAGVQTAGVQTAGVLTAGSEPGFGARLRPLVAGGAAGLVIAVPVLAWILLSVDAAPLDFDYRAFLWSHYPYHFFLEASPWQAIAKLGLCVASGVAALHLLGGRLGLAAFLGLVLVFAAGAVVGATVSAPLVLNLHLLRVDGLITVLAAAGAAAAAMRALGRPAAGSTAAGCGVVLGLLLDQWPLVLLALGVLFGLRRGLRLPVPEGFGRLWQDGRFRRVMAAAAAAALVVHGVALARAMRYEPPPGTLPPQNRFYAGRWPAVPHWQAVKQWARAQTPAGAVFLTPLMLDNFQTDARRRAWVEWKQGSAVLWAQGYHREWAARYDAVLALRSPRAMIEYACAHAIDFVVIDRRVAPSGVPGLAAVYDNPGFAVYGTAQAGSQCAGSP